MCLKLILNFSCVFSDLRMECQVGEIEHFRYYLFFLFNQGIMATEPSREFCVVSEEGAARATN